MSRIHYVIISSACAVIILGTILYHRNYILNAFPKQDIHIELPSASYAADHFHYEAIAKIAMTRDGQLHFKDSPTSSQELILAFDATKMKEMDYCIYFRVDKNTPFTHVNEVLSALQANGYFKLCFSVEQPF